jgi:hypothetical protein
MVDEERRNGGMLFKFVVDDFVEKRSEVANLVERTGANLEKVQYGGVRQELVRLRPKTVCASLGWTGSGDNNLKTQLLAAVDVQAGSGSSVWLSGLVPLAGKRRRVEKSNLCDLGMETDKGTERGQSWPELHLFHLFQRDGSVLNNNEQEGLMILFLFHSQSVWETVAVSGMGDHVSTMMTLVHCSFRIKDNQLPLMNVAVRDYCVNDRCSAGMGVQKAFGVALRCCREKKPIEAEVRRDGKRAR